MVNGVKIEKKDTNVVAHFLFGFIISNLMPSQNESILLHPKLVLVGTIIDGEEVNVGQIIEEKCSCGLRKSKHH